MAMIGSGEADARADLAVPCAHLDLLNQSSGK
jgi:hypothetical protein